MGYVGIVPQHSFMGHVFPEPQRVSETSGSAKRQAAQFQRPLC